MLLTRSLALALLVFSASSFAFASGSKAGNGGHGVRCGGGRAELLDLYEARETYGLLPSGNWFASVDEEITRLELETAMALGANDPFLSIFNDARLLLQSLELVPGPLGFTQDAGFVLGQLPLDCELVQLAVRGSYAGQNTHVTALRADWQMMLATEKALLLIHEAAHARFMLSPAVEMPTTLAIRQLVGFLSAPSDIKIKKAEFIRRLIRTQVPLSVAEMKP